MQVKIRHKLSKTKISLRERRMMHRNRIYQKSKKRLLTSKRRKLSSSTTGKMLLTTLQITS